MPQNSAPGSIPAQEARDPGATRRAGPLQAAGRPDPQPFAHEDPQIMRGHLQQVALGDMDQPAQPTPPGAPSFADMGKGPFDVLTPFLLQPFAPGSLHPAAVAAVGTLPGLGLVGPDPRLGPLLLGD